MTGLLGPITATFSIVSDAHVPVEHAVREILEARYLEPRRVHARNFGERSFATFAQPGTNEAEAEAVLREIRALAAVRSAVLECHLERRPPRPKLHLFLEPERVDVV